MQTSKRAFIKAWEKHKCHILQSWQWAESRHRHEAILLDSIPLVLRQGRTKLFKRSFLTVQRAGWQDIDFIDLTQSIDVKLRQHGYRYDWLVVEPNKTITESNMHQSRQTSTHLESVFVSLDKTENELYAQLNKSTRQKLRRAEKNGLKYEVFTEGEEGLNRFVSVMKQVRTSKKYVQVPVENYINTWRHLAPADMSYIVIGVHDNQDVAAYMRAYGNGVAYQLYGGTTSTGRQLQVNEYLLFQSMLVAKSLGNKVYDMWGAGPFSLQDGFIKSHELYGISKFKIGFGGYPVAFEPAHLVVHNNFSFWVYKLERILASLVLKLRKKL